MYAAIQQFNTKLFMLKSTYDIRRNIVIYLKLITLKNLPKMYAAIQQFMLKSTYDISRNIVIYLKLISLKNLPKIYAAISFCCRDRCK